VVVESSLPVLPEHFNIETLTGNLLSLGGCGGGVHEKKVDVRSNACRSDPWQSKFKQCFESANVAVSPLL
jgi:hypothetical protein